MRSLFTVTHFVYVLTIATLHRILLGSCLYCRFRSGNQWNCGGVTLRTPCGAVSDIVGKSMNYALCTHIFKSNPSHSFIRKSRIHTHLLCIYTLFVVNRLDMVGYITAKAQKHILLIHRDWLWSCLVDQDVPKDCY